jgi:predicted transcriptional regulator
MENAQNDMNETLITLTSDIVAAHVSNNSVSAEELATLISSVYGALADLGKPAPVAEEAPPKPAVSIRASVKNEHLVCLDCGMELKMLKRHLMTHHGMSPDQYRARWNLSNDYPLVAPDYAEKRRDLAKKIGLGRKPGARRGRKAKVAA